MSFFSQICSWLRDLFSFKPVPSKDRSDDLDNIEAMSFVPFVPSVFKSEEPVREVPKYFLSSSEYHGVKILRSSHRAQSEQAIIRVAISALLSGLDSGTVERHELAVPPPVGNGAWGFSLERPTESRLGKLSVKVRITDRNTVIRIAVRKLLAANNIDL